MRNLDFNCHEKLNQQSRISILKDENREGGALISTAAAIDFKSYMKLCQIDEQRNTAEGAKPDRQKFVFRKFPINYQFNGYLDKKRKKSYKRKKFQKNSSKCTICSKSLANAFSLKRHTKTVHQSPHPFTCYLCGIQIRSLDHFEKHMNDKHFQDKQSVFKCTLCSKSLANAFSLRRHTKTVHQFEPSCYICEKKFSQKYQLRWHMIIKHCDVDHSISTSKCTENDSLLPDPFPSEKTPLNSINRIL